MPEMKLSADFWTFTVSGINDENPEVLDQADLQFWQQIHAYMLWPEDEARRQSHIAELFVIMQAAVEEYTTDSISQLGSAIADGASLAFTQSFRNAGGWRSISRLYMADKSAEIHERANSVELAGKILATIRAIEELEPGSGSLNKAVYVMDNANIAARTRLFAAWRIHKTVAHLGVAAFMSPIADFDNVSLDRFWGIALDYQSFATAGHRRPLIAPAEIWALPARPDLIAADNYCARLTPEMVEALQSYRARQ